MKRFMVLISALFLCGVAVGGFVEANFDNDFVGYELLGSIVQNDFTPLMLNGVSVSSAVYSNGASFLYVYQVVNGSTSTLSRYTMSAFQGLSSNSEMGYFVGNQPTGFAAAGANPVSSTTSDITTSPTVGFNFRDGQGGAGISPGSSSSVLFVLSEYSSGTNTISGQVLGSSGAFGQVVGPVPEPATIALLALGSLAIGIRKKSA